MQLEGLDRLLLRGVLRGLSAAELAAQTGMPATWVDRRIESLLQSLSNFGVPQRPLPVPVVQHPRLVALLRLWNARRGKRTLPAHGTLRLTDLQPWIRHVAVMEMVGTPPQPRSRIEGRKLVKYMGGDISGRYLVDHVPKDFHFLALEPFRRSAEQGLPQYDVLTSSLAGWERLRLHRLLLPHARDGHNVDIILAAAYIEADQEVEMEFSGGFYDLQPRKAS